MTKALKHYTAVGTEMVQRLREHADTVNNPTRALCQEAADDIEMLLRRLHSLELWTDPELFMKAAKSAPLSDKWMETHQRTYVSMEVVMHYLLAARSAAIRDARVPSLWRRVRTSFTAARSAWSKAK
jgi:hypothetical protein